MPPPCFNHSPIVHPAPIIGACINVAQCFLWRKMLPSRMGINHKIYLQPCKHNHRQQWLGPIIPLCSSPIHGTSRTISSWQHPFWNCKRPHSGHSYQPKRYGWPLYQQLHRPYSQHWRHRQCSKTKKSFSPWSQYGSSRSLQIQTPSLNVTDAPAKLIAEMSLSEQKIILGCIQDFHQMTIVLPEKNM